MALTDFQRAVCRLLANNRRGNAQSYVAGGAALNEVIPSQRLSYDIDVFHDTQEALEVTWRTDRDLLIKSRYSVNVVRELTGFIEAEISLHQESVLLQWARDSAFRFFPLLPHSDFGFTLHPFDLATNKVLALVGRQEARDWIDSLTCHQHVSPLGLLAWAACGKDEGWNPQLIIDEANRNARMSREEWREVEWQGTPPDFVKLKTSWREAMSQAREMIQIIPPEQVGKAVLLPSGEAFNGSIEKLQSALKDSQIEFHEGHIGGAWPQIK